MWVHCNLLNDIIINSDYIASHDWTKTRWLWKEGVVANFRVLSKFLPKQNEKRN